MDPAPPNHRMIGCRNCQAAVPFLARFCVRCGHAMSASTADAPRVVRPADTPPHGVGATGGRRAPFEYDVERAIDRSQPPRVLGTVAFFLLLIGGVVTATGTQFGVFMFILGCIVLTLDIRNHVRVRERAERQVRAERRSSSPT